MAGHRRRISKFQKQEKQTKLKRMKSKVLNWINGHPVTEDPLSEETKVKNNSKLFRRKQLEETDSRMIFVNRAVTEDQPNFPLNKIRTAKYKVHTFLVKNLFEQFRRVANFYFLTLVLLQAVPEFNQVNIVLDGFPLFMIVGVTALKDAFEDWKRSKSDREVNYAETTVLGNWNNPNAVYSTSNIVKHWFLRVYEKLKSTPKKDGNIEMQPINEEVQQTAHFKSSEAEWRKCFWRDARVGDIVLLKDNDPVPADILILATSEEDSVCYIETKNLDGETNLKIRKGLTATGHLRTPEDCAGFPFVVELEKPNTNLYSFVGSIKIGSPGKREKVHPLDINNILLRGCFIRNTEWVIGLIVYTGKDCKLMMNSGITPSKRSRIERLMNPQIIVNFFWLFVICLICAIGRSQSLRRTLGASFEFSTFSPGVDSSSLYRGFLSFWYDILILGMH